MRLPSGFVFDLDGVVEGDDQLEPGAIELVTFARDMGTPFVILTNDIRSCCYDRVKQLAEWGLAISRQRFVTPYDSLAAVLKAEGLRSPRFFGAPSPPELIDVWCTTDDDADSVVLGDVGLAIDQLNECALLVESGLPLFALQKNSFVRSAGGFVADVGYHVAAWEYCLASPATVIGKPSMHGYAVASSRLGCELSQTLMISDNFTTDLAGALSAGMSGMMIEKYARRSEVDAAQKAGVPVLRDLFQLIHHLADDV